MTIRASSPDIAEAALRREIADLRGRLEEALAVSREERFQSVRSLWSAFQTVAGAPV